jgi:hypothetical protein
MFTTSDTDDVAGTPTDRVLAALAAKQGCDPIEFSTPLYEVVDPDAMDGVFRADSNHEMYVGFSFGEHAVQVHGDGTVYVNGERFDEATGTFESV